MGLAVEKKEGLLIELRFALVVLVTALSNYLSKLFINILVVVVALVRRTRSTGSETMGTQP